MIVINLIVTLLPFIKAEILLVNYTNVADILANPDSTTTASAEGFGFGK